MTKEQLDALPVGTILFRDGADRVYNGKTYHYRYVYLKYSAQQWRCTSNNSASSREYTKDMVGGAYKILLMGWND